MGSFANAVFSVLLGWMQNLVSAIWSALTSEDVNPFFLFISKNWLKIAAVLCIVGLAIDFAVYFFRWKPYEVWRSFLHNFNKGKIQNNDPEQETETDRQDRFLFQHADSYEDDKETEPDDLSRWRDAESKEISCRAAPKTTDTDYIVSEDSPYKRPVIKNRRRRVGINQIFGDSTNEEDYHYVAPRPIMDQKDAYHAPVYPEKWTGSRDQDS